METIRKLKSKMKKMSAEEGKKGGKRTGTKTGGSEFSVKLLLPTALFVSLSLPPFFTLLL